MVSFVNSSLAMLPDRLFDGDWIECTACNNLGPCDFPRGFIDFIPGCEMYLDRPGLV
jgi:hypothetical protein